MTVIVGFISSKPQRGYLGTDNLATPSWLRTDKLAIVNQRFAVACLGSEVALTVVNGVAGFVASGGRLVLRDGKRHSPPDTVQSLLDQVAIALPSIAAAKHALVVKAQSSRQGKDFLSRMPSTKRSVLVILDMKKPRLHQVVIAPLNPPAAKYSLTATPLLPDRWHTWPPDLIEVTTPLPPPGEEERHLEAAIRLAKVRYPNNRFGKPGASVTVGGAGWHVRTAFESLEDFAIEAAKDMMSLLLIGDPAP